ncbi:DUF4249 family protein [Pedobacter sp. PAMC26386]|nr:DUF4249 family protein [Pedobacter sp. PAMC26386]
MELNGKRNLLILLILLLISSCEKETKVDISGNPTRLVVLGEFNQQDAALINLSTSVISVPAGGFPDVQDAQVGLFDQNNTLIEKYTYQGKGNYTGKKATAGQGYQLVIDYKGKTYKAHTTIPLSFKLNLKSLDSTSLEAEIVDSHPGANAFTFELIERRYTVARYYFENEKKINVNTEAELISQLERNPAIQIKRDTTFDSKFTRVYISTTDRRTENVRYNVLKDGSGRIYLTDKTFNGSQTTLKILFPDNTLDQENTQYSLLVKSTSAVYFDYLYSMDLQAAKAIGGTLDVPIKGNIDNALGIWGAAYIQKVILKN